MKEEIKNIIFNMLFATVIVVCIMFFSFKNDLKTKKYEENIIYDFTDDTSFATSINFEDSSFLIFAVSDEYGKRVEGVGFEIYNQNHESIAISYTNSEGKAGFSGIDNGTYFIRVTSTPSQYENISTEYVIKKENENEAFKKNIKIKTGKKEYIKDYNVESITPFKKRNIWSYEDEESKSDAINVNVNETSNKENINSQEKNYIAYSTLINDKFEGMQIETVFNNVDSTSDYNFVKNVNLKIKGAKIISYNVSFSKNLDKVKVLNSNDEEKENFDGKSSFIIASNEKLDGKICKFSVVIEKNFKKYKMNFEQKIPSM